MTNRDKPNSKKYKISAQLESIEHIIFIASWLDFKPTKKTLNSNNIHGFDLISRKICPDLEMFFEMLSEITNADIKSIDDIISSEFIIPKAITTKIISETFISKALENKEELLHIWMTIATHETIEFINHLLHRVKVDSVCSTKAKIVVGRLLQNYGTGQLWNLAYRANQKACEIILSKNIEEEKRPDLYLDIFMQKGIQHIENGWKLAPFKRWGFQCKQSEYSKFFFDQILGISEDGFNYKPCLSHLSE